VAKLKELSDELGELLDKGLFLHNLTAMKNICYKIMEQTEEPLAFYVLASVFYDIWDSWYEKAVYASQVKALEESLLPLMKDVLIAIGNSELPIALNNLVRQYLTTIKKVSS